MFQRILVAINKSDVSLKVLKEAIALAKALDARLKLIHVLDDRDPENPPFPYITELSASTDLNATVLDAYQEEYQSFINRSWQWLDWHGKEVANTGVQADWDQAHGVPGKAICQTAQTWNADLIMIGSRGLSGLPELLLGSVSNYVVHHAPCSVYVCHPNPSQPEELETIANAQDDLPSKPVGV